MHKAGIQNTSYSIKNILRLPKKNRGFLMWVSTVILNFVYSIWKALKTSCFYVDSYGGSLFMFVIAVFSYTKYATLLTVHRIVRYFISILMISVVAAAFRISSTFARSLVRKKKRFGAIIIATLFKPILLMFSAAMIFDRNFSSS